MTYTTLDEIGGYEGTLYFEGSFISEEGGLGLFDDFGIANQMYIARTPNSGGTIEVLFQGSNFVQIEDAAIPLNTFCKIAVTYKNREFLRLYVNGVKYTTADIPIFQNNRPFSILSYSFRGTPNIGMNLDGIVLYKAALSDTEAINLTIIS